MSAEPVETGAELVPTDAVSDTANGTLTPSEIGAENGEFPAMTVGEARALAILEDREAATVLDFARKARADSTVRAYETAWAEFERFCAERRRRALPADGPTVARYITHLARDRGQRPATIAKKLTAISVRHRRANKSSPRAHPLVAEALVGIYRDLTRKQPKKTPARKGDLRLMVEQLDPDRLLDVRDHALLMVGFGGAFRRSELVSFTVADIEDRGDWLFAYLATSKTDQEGEGATVAIPWGREEALCPIRALRRWYEASGITEGPVWRPVGKGGRLAGKALDARDVARVMKRRAAAAGLNPDSYAGHSLRSGFITEAAHLHVPERDIMRHSRHKSERVMRGYIDYASLTVENAAAAILGPVDA